jgi:hypothetical protein
MCIGATRPQQLRTITTGCLFEVPGLRYFS